MELKISKVYEIPAAEYNQKLAAELAKLPEYKMPEWAYFVKTGVSKSRPPESSEWWFRRAASILRQIYIQGVVGVSRLRTKYGSRKNRGMRPEVFGRASGKIIRVMLQAGEKVGLLEKVKEGRRFGRKLTKQGIALLESIN